MKDYKQKFQDFLENEIWHTSMLPIVDVLIKSGLTDIDFDEFIQSITKCVETALREAYNKKTGSKIDDTIVGISLLDKTVHGHLIQNKEEPLYALIYFILKEPRNISHHHFTIFPFKTLVKYTLDCDEALNRIEKLLQSGYHSNFKITLENDSALLNIYDVEVFSPDYIKLNDDAKVEATTKYGDGTQKNIPLTYTSGYWHGTYDNRGTPMGTLNVSIHGFHKSIRFVAQSGSTVVSCQSGRVCGSCDRSLGDKEFKCPRCGSYQYIE